MSISDAFAQTCKNAKIAKSVCVSLYRRDSVYGGPEEGGWWRNHRSLVSYQYYPTEEEAEQVRGKIEELAKELSREETQKHGLECGRQLDWCEARGIDDANSVFGEVDGAAEFFVAVENQPGEQEHRDTEGWS